MTLVVDASVAVKLFLEEDHSDLARGLLSAVDELIVAPAHLLAEVGEVAVRRHRARQISVEQLTALQSFLPRGLVSVPLDQVFESASVIALETGSSFYDALYVATAERWSAFVLTADEKLVARLARSRWATRVRSLAAWAASGKRIP